MAVEVDTANISYFAVEKRLEADVRGLNDSAKLICDLVKHSTTLSAGTLVLSSSLFPTLSLGGQRVLHCGFAVLGISMIVAQITMLLLVDAPLFEAASRAQNRDLMSDISGKIKWGTNCLMIALATSCLGVILVVVAGAIGRQ